MLPIETFNCRSLEWLTYAVCTIWTLIHPCHQLIIVISTLISSNCFRFLVLQCLEKCFYYNFHHPIIFNSTLFSLILLPRTSKNNMGTLHGCCTVCETTFLKGCIVSVCFRSLAVKLKYLTIKIVRGQRVDSKLK